MQRVWNKLTEKCLVLSLLFSDFFFPVSAKKIQHCIILSNICLTGLYTAQCTGNYDFTCMLNCFFSSPARGKTIHIVAVITLFLFVSVSASLEVFLSGWHCGEGLERPLWSFPSVKIAALCDVLIGNKSRVAPQASECLRTTGPLCMGKQVRGFKGSAQPDDLEEVEGDEVIRAWFPNKTEDNSWESNDPLGLT